MDASTLASQGHFYFEAQTGLLKDHAWESNYYIYKLPMCCLA